MDNPFSLDVPLILPMKICTKPLEEDTIIVLGQLERCYVGGQMSKLAPPCNTIEVIMTSTLPSI